MARYFFAAAFACSCLGLFGGSVAIAQQAAVYNYAYGYDDYGNQVRSSTQVADRPAPLGDVAKTRYTGDHTVPYQYARYYGRSLYRPYVYQPRMSYWYGTYPYTAYTGYGYRYPYSSWYGSYGYPYSLSYPYGYSYYNYRPAYYAYPAYGNWSYGGYYGYPAYSSAGYWGSWGTSYPYIGSSSYLVPSYSSYYAPACTSYHGGGAVNRGCGNYSYYW